LLSTLALASSTSAQEKPREIKDRLILERMRAGLPDGRSLEKGRYKPGFWTPVYVDVTIGPQDIAANELVLIVETADNDGILNLYKQPVPFVLPKKQTVTGLMTYVRPGSLGSDIYLTLELGGKTFKRERLPPESGGVENGGVLWLTLGSKLPGLQRALSRKPGSFTTTMVTFGNNGSNDTITRNDGGDWGKDDFVQGQTIHVSGKGNNNGFYTIQSVRGTTLVLSSNGTVTPEGPETKTMEAIPDDDSMDSAFRQFAAIDKVELMPRHWFGYQAVDLMVLTSSDEKFVTALIADQSGRTRALAEWVRRGGRLIISTAQNQQLVNQLLAEMRLMNCTIEGKVQRQFLMGFQAVTSGRRDRFPAQGGVEIAKIVPGLGVDLLDEQLSAEADARDMQARPLAVQAAAGLGHVILIGCDLDAPPFTAWKGQADFWRFLQSKIEPRLGVREDMQNPGGRVRISTNDSNELAVQLQNSLERFGDITVISFGWVALFILIYIIIVGPLDYLFLKKVLKRLELTWITFPVVVLVVSAAAYFTAYYLKGNDLKINKLDVVDIDLTPAVDATRPPPRIYGSTWFTLFSPRIQHYTIGVEAADGWGGGQQKDTALIGWMGRPDNTMGGTGRAGAPSLFRRTYEFAPEASGLTGVPIQVWATKSFAATWVVQPQSDQAPIEANLKHPPADPSKVMGTVTNNLPADLFDVVAFYKGNAFLQGRIGSGEMQRLDFTGRPAGVLEWMGKPFTAAARPPGSPTDDIPAWSLTPAMKSMFFNDVVERGGDRPRSNTTVRYLDQGWRLAKDRDEVVLVGRVEARIGDGPAEKVATDPATPSRLWLGALPGSGSRPKLEGTLTQRTFVRVYIPVRSSAK
jgi:hypothetical protein